MGGQKSKPTISGLPDNPSLRAKATSPLPVAKSKTLTQVSFLAKETSFLLHRKSIPQESR